VQNQYGATHIPVSALIGPGFLMVFCGPANNPTVDQVVFVKP